MSKWTAEFEQHPFQQSWLDLKTQIEKLEVDDQTVTTSVQELARLKRVINYISVLLEKVDPELTPKSVWNNFHPQVDACLQNTRNFAADKGISWIARANENADNLLTYLRPYEVFPQAVIEGFSAAARSLTTSLEAYIGSFKEKADVLIQEIDAEKSTSRKLRSSAETSELKIAALTKKLLHDDEGRQSIESQIDYFLLKANNNSQAIADLHAGLLVGTPDSPSTQSRISALESNIGSTQAKINTLFSNVEVNVKELDSFHTKIFGRLDEAGKPLGGLSFELDNRTRQLGILEGEQKEKYRALVEQIESALPGATSAGLGTAYRDLKMEFTKPISTYTRLFYGSIALLVIGAAVVSINSISLLPVLAIDFIKPGEWDLVLRALLHKAPFVAPVVWLALFSSKRRSQYERLQQEYAHKEALARSYESYRKQLLELKIETEELQKELLAKTIEAISYNASVTLDGKHEEKLPIQQLVEKLTLDDLKRLLETLRRGGG